MNFYTYTVVFWPEKDDPETFNVSIPSLPEICTFGTSIEEARFMAQDALELTILSRLEGGESIPQDKKPTRLPEGSKIEKLVVTVSHQVEATREMYVKNALTQTA